jgi:hypothetical protein
VYGGGARSARAALRSPVLGACSLTLSAVLAWGCGGGLAELAATQAERELHCNDAALRMRSVGALEVGRKDARHRVELYEASGCDQEQLYLCARGGRDCARDIATLPWPADHPALTRAFEVLHMAARARCPESDLLVSAESETLFRFTACDGRWLYHCRARGCEQLPVREPPATASAVKKRTIDLHR